MRTVPCLALFTLGLVFSSGCGSADDRQWMKINQRYTTEEFQRDYKACTPENTLDESCMRNRGWVEVSQSKTDRDEDPRAKEPPRSRSRVGAPGGSSTGR